MCCRVDLNHGSAHARVLELIETTTNFPITPDEYAPDTYNIWKGEESWAKLSRGFGGAGVTVQFYPTIITNNADTHHVVHALHMAQVMKLLVVASDELLTPVAQESLVSSCGGAFHRIVYQPLGPRELDGLCRGFAEALSQGVEVL